jgi:hypothetical protein
MISTTKDGRSTSILSGNSVGTMATYIMVEVHTYTTDQGMIFVNLSSGEPAAFGIEVVSSLNGLV